MKSGALLRIIAYLLIYLGVPVVGLILNHETITAVLAIIYIFLLIPFGILRMIDFYRSNDGTSALSRTFNLLFRVPLGLFGLVCVAVGFGIIGWVLYNLFVERQKEYSGPSFISGLGSFGVSVPLILFGWFTLRSSFRRKQKVGLNSGEQESEHEEDDEERVA